MGGFIVQGELLEELSRGCEPHQGCVAVLSLFLVAEGDIFPAVGHCLSWLWPHPVSWPAFPRGPCETCLMLFWASRSFCQARVLVGYP